MVSRRRRSEPAAVTDSTESPTCLMNSARRSASRSPASMRKRPEERFADLRGFQNILLAFFAETRQIAQFPFASELFEVSHGGAFEIRPEERDLLGAQRLQSEQLEQRRRIFFQKFLSQLVVAGLEDLADVLGHVFADARELAKLLDVFGEVFDALVEAEK